MRTCLRLVGLVASLALVACGPPQPSSDAESDTGEDSSDTSEPDLPQPDPPQPDPPQPDPPEPDDTGLSFVPFNDFICTFPCDPFLQDCPDGEKCVPYASTGEAPDSNKCVPVTGNQAAGDPCSYAGPIEASDDCDGSSTCWDVQDVDGQLLGTCRAFCGGTADAPECADGQACLITNDASVNVCLQTCDPLLQDCAEGTACIWGQEAFVCTTLSGAQGTGEPCAGISDCAQAQLCIDSSALPSCAGTSCCTPYCDLGQGDAGCASLPGTSCTSFFGPDTPPAGLEQLGVCAGL